jgi:hypothetical protein
MSIEEKNIKLVKGIYAFLLPFAVFIIELIIRSSNGNNIIDGLGTSLASIGIGQIFPFVIFESVIIGKLISVNATIRKEDKSIIVSYPLEMENKSINLIKILTSLFFVGCVIIWIAVLSISANDIENQKSFLTIGLGSLNSILAWVYLVFI